MSDHPTDTTSNYGWALWHLEQATAATNYVAAQVHATAAAARATLAAIDARDGLESIGSTWTSPTTSTHQPTEEI